MCPISYPAVAAAHSRQATDMYIEAHSDHGEERGIAIRLRRNHRADADRPRARRGRCEERPRLEAAGCHAVGVEEEMVRHPVAGEACALRVVSDRDELVELEAELRLDLDAEIHQSGDSAPRPPVGPEAWGPLSPNSSSAVRRNIMCRPVTVSVASMNAANTAIPAFASGPSPTTNALNAATSASHTTNARPVSWSWNAIGRRG